MNKTGHKFILIPYDLLIDTDVGLYKLLEKKYCNDNVFFTEPLTELDMPHLLYFLVHRQEVNPLDTISKKEDPELMKEYYDEFFDKEYDYILRRSITTSLYDFVKDNSRDPSIHVTVWVPSEEIQRILRERDPEGFGGVQFRVAKTFSECVQNNDELIYIKDIEDIRRNTRPFLGKTLYIADYDFNNEEHEVTHRRCLKVDVTDLVNRKVYITAFDPYREEDLATIAEAEE